MKSALIIDFHDRHGHERALGDLLAELRYLAGELGTEVRLSFQNNLKTEVLAIMVETKNKTLGGHGDTFLKAVAAATNDVREYRDRLQAPPVPASRAKGSKGRRR